jgi:hypothetical protein
MTLTEEDERFLRKREALTRAWPIFGGFLLAALTFWIGWMLWRNTLVVNPYAMLGAIRDGTIEQSTLQLMAGMLPVAMILIFGLSAGIVLLLYGTFSNEKRYLGIIRGSR